MMNRWLVHTSLLVWTWKERPIPKKRFIAICFSESENTLLKYRLRDVSVSCTVRKIVAMTRAYRHVGCIDSIKSVSKFTASILDGDSISTSLIHSYDKNRKEPGKTYRRESTRLDCHIYAMQMRWARVHRAMDQRRKRQRDGPVEQVH